MTEHMQEQSKVCNTIKNNALKKSGRYFFISNCRLFITHAAHITLHTNIITLLNQTRLKMHCATSQTHIIKQIFDSKTCSITD